MPSYDALKKKQAELIRKALDGSVFIAPISATGIVKLTQMSTDTTPVPELAPLPAEYEDLGWLTTDGAQFSRDVSASDVASWGSVTPTRSDITSDSTTLAVTAQETKLLTIGLATGADLSAATPDAGTGEIRVAKPNRASAKSYRALSIAVDQGDAGEIYIARFLPRAKVNSYTEQAFGGGDDPITWGVTMVGEPDSTLGFSEQWLFGGAGWKAILTDMGFPAAA